MSARAGNDQLHTIWPGTSMNEQGVYAASKNRQTSFRSTCTNTSAQVRCTRARRLHDDQAAAAGERQQLDGVLSSGLLGRADSVNQGYGFLTPKQSFSIGTTRESIALRQHPAHLPARDWLTFNGALGVDFTSRFDEKTFIPGGFPRRSA